MKPTAADHSLCKDKKKVTACTFNNSTMLFKHFFLSVIKEGIPKVRALYTTLVLFKFVF